MKLIAGIDPGKTAGIALVDISSGFTKVFSRRDFSISDICSYLVEHGEPIIIATDKNDVPAAVKKIAATFNSQIYSPKADMGILEKKDITKNFTFDNDHEKDALAAALLAKKEFSGLFEKVEYALQKRQMPHLFDAVIELLVKNEVGNIEQAIKLLVPRKQEKEVKIIPKIIETKKLRELNEKLREKDRIIEMLRNQISELRKDYSDLRRSMSKGSDDSRIENLRKSIATLREEKEEMIKEKEKTEKMKKLREKYEIIYRPEDFSDPKNMEAKVILLEDSGLSIARFNPKAIISERIADKEKNMDVPVIQRQKINIRKIDNVLVADKKEIEKLIRENFFAWLDKYKERFHEH